MLRAKSTLAAIALFALAFPASAQSTITVAFADPAWDGVTVPAGQHCPLQGGKGATPALEVSGLPEAAYWIDVEFNDESYGPLSTDGGHGIIGFPITPVDGKATLPSVPGNTADVGAEATVVAAARAPGAYASPGYLPPCSGGRGNTYSATLRVREAEGAELAMAKITLGKY